MVSSPYRSSAFLFADHFAGSARGKLLALARERIGQPDGPQLERNAPNPFDSGTVISGFLLLRSGRVRRVGWKEIYPVCGVPNALGPMGA